MTKANMYDLRPICLILLMVFTISVSANGLSITNVQRDSLNQTVSFDIHWYNSWRVDSLATPYNWDAAWVFVKFQDCDASPSDPWIHGALNDSLVLHDFGKLEPVFSDGSSLGLDTDLKGVMLRRSSNGLFGNTAPTRITLKLTNMISGVAYNLRVIATEMVFVKEGAFELGGITAGNAFSANTTSNDPAVAPIVSESAVTLNSHAGGNDATITLSPGFPKGFGGFHLMKYEITEEQYAVFLNSIPRAVQSTRYPGNYGNNRQNLVANGNNPLHTYQTDRPDRAQNFLSWDDVAAFLDWACLRPMTELEYEKACRGIQSAVADECAWGTASAFELTDITAPEDGTEIPGNLPANANFINNNLNGGDGGRGPVRVGIFALPGNATRIQAGGTYYGALEMSGNVWEYCVGALYITSIAGSVNFTDAPGDGVLGTNGQANQNGWPSITSGGHVIRGGSWNDNLAELRVASRYIGWSGNRNYNTGGRGVR